MVIKMISIVISFLKNKGRLQFLFLKSHFTILRSTFGNPFPCTVWLSSSNFSSYRLALVPFIQMGSSSIQT